MAFSRNAAPSARSPNPCSVHKIPAPKRWALVLLSAGLLALPGTALQAQAPHRTTPAPLPQLGDGHGLSLADERRLGDRIARDIYRDPDYLDDPVLGDYLQSIWQPLLAAARERGDVPPELAERLAWELMISRDRRVNAFALPGGYLGVHLGLMAVTERPEELASVLAHELSHVSQRHIARLMASQDRMAPWMMGALILGALAARSSVDLANAAIVGGQALAVQNQLNFSRDRAREADRIGFGVLTSAGFDGQGFVDMFERLQQAARLNDDGSFPYLRSHPLTTERMADMRARLPVRSSLAAPTGGAVRMAPTPSAAQHALIAARARVLAENAPDRLSAWWTQGLAEQATAAERYAGALAGHRLGQREAAAALAQRLAASQVGDARWTADALLLELWLDTAHAQASTGGLPAASQAALAALGEQALRRGGRSGVLLGTQVALVGGDAPRAIGRLRSWVLDHPRDALAWQWLARAHEAQGERLRSLRAEAEARAAHGDLDGALQRLRAAQALPAALRAGDAIELAIVDTRRRELEQLQREWAADSR